MIGWSALELVVLGLATWRISHMLTSERGPFDMFIKLRDKMGFVHDEFGHVIGRPDTNVLACTWCTSFWIAMILLVVFVDPLLWWMVVPFAVSAMAIIINEKLV